MQQLKENEVDIFRGADVKNGLSAYPIISYSDVRSYNDNLLLDDTIDIRKYGILETKENQVLQSIKKLFIQKFDIIFPMKIKNHVPRIITWKDQMQNINAIYGGDVIIIRVKPNSNIYARFLFHILNTSTVISIINEKAAQEKPNRITIKMLEDLTLNIPDVNVQKQFVNELDKINKQRVQIEAKFEEFCK